MTIHSVAMEAEGLTCSEGARKGALGENSALARLGEGRGGREGKGSEQCFPVSTEEWWGSMNTTPKRHPNLTLSV